MTPIQIIISKLEKLEDPVALKMWLEDNLPELLEIEKDIIIDAFFEGGLTNEPYEPLTGADYYNIHFKEWKYITERCRGTVAYLLLTSPLGKRTTTI